MVTDLATRTRTLQTLATVSRADFPNTEAFVAKYERYVTGNPAPSARLTHSSLNENNEKKGQRRIHDPALKLRRRP